MQPIEKRPDAWIERAPERTTAAREIAASPQEIWAVLADHGSWPEWFEAVKGVTVTGAASGVGAERRVSLPGLQIDEEITVWDVGERYAFTATAMSRAIFKSLAERITLEDLSGERTRVAYTQAFDPSWWFRVPFKLVRRRFERDLRDALNGLAARVE